MTHDGDPQVRQAQALEKIVQIVEGAFSRTRGPGGWRIEGNRLVLDTQGTHVAVELSACQIRSLGEALLRQADRLQPSKESS